MIHTDTFSVCEDCFMLEATGDATSFDYHYEGAEADRRLKECEDGMVGLTRDGGHLSAGEQTDGFSRSPCECCGSPLAGARYSLYLLKPEDNPLDALRGSVVRYDNPTDPVAEKDWEKPDERKK
jgi:hypothetical protein